MLGNYLKIGDARHRRDQDFGEIFLLCLEPYAGDR